MYTDDQLNSAMIGSQMQDLAINKQLGDEVSPLLELYNSNPELAANLSNQLLDYGYKTTSEIDRLAQSNINKGDEEGTSWLRGVYSGIKGFITGEEGLSKDQDPNEFSKRAFNDYYKEAKQNYQNRVKNIRTKLDIDPELVEQQIIQEARKKYLKAQNKNIFEKVIKPEIDNYRDQQATTKALEIRKELDINSETPEQKNEISNAFNKLAQGESRVNPNTGKIEFVGGAPYFRAYKDVFFDDMSLDEQKDILSKYQGYVQTQGEEAANKWLRDTFQDRVDEYYNSGIFSQLGSSKAWLGKGLKAMNTATAFSNTVLNNIGPRLLSGGLQIMAGAIGFLSSIGNSDKINYAQDVASALSTGKDASGIPIQESQRFPDRVKVILSHLSGDYLDKVDRYNTWFKDEQEWIEANSNVSPLQQQTSKSNQQDHDFLTFSTLQDILNMTAQVTSQTLAIAALGSESVPQSLMSLISANGVRALASKQAIKTIGAGLKDAALVQLPISESYAYRGYEQLYNGVIEQAQQHTLDQFEAQAQTPEYISQRDKAYKDWLSSQTTESGAYLDTPETRDQFNQQYDEQQYNSLWDQRKNNVSQMAHQAGLGTYLSVFALEYAKYGGLNALVQPLKWAKNPNEVLKTQIKTNSYGRLTTNNLHRVTNQGQSILGIKKFTTLNPRILGTQAVAKNAIVQGGLTNYTDEMSVGFGMGYGIDRFNSEYLRQYDPVAYANTYSDNDLSNMIGSLEEAVLGGVKAGLTKQALDAFVIGSLGGMVAPRFTGRKEMRERYEAQNRAYKIATGKEVSKNQKLRQLFNTYFTGSIGEYESTRFGLREQKKAIKQHNMLLDQKEELLQDLGSISQLAIDTRASEAQNDFVRSADINDATAMKLIANSIRLKNSPYYGLDKQVADAGIAQIEKIINNDLTREEKDNLITQAASTRKSKVQSQLDQDTKDQIWKDIQESATRTKEFIQDFNQARQEEIDKDSSYDSPENRGLLYQLAESKAKLKRVERDQKLIQEKLGIQIGSPTNINIGLKTDSQKNIYRTKIDSIIEAQKEEIHQQRQKIEDIEEQLDDDTITDIQRNKLKKQLILTKSRIRWAQRAQDQLQDEIDLQTNSTLVDSESIGHLNPIAINDMLTSPDNYAPEQKQEIEKFRQKIGYNGSIYINILAQLQDQKDNLDYSIQSLREEPQDFIALQDYVFNYRSQARQLAAQEQNKLNLFQEFKEVGGDIGAALAAIMLPSKLYNEFTQYAQGMSAELNNNKELNTYLSDIGILISNINEPNRQSILSSIVDLVLEDPDYILQNKQQGVVDMLQFLSDNTTESSIKQDLQTLITDFMRVSSIEVPTNQNTSYKKQSQEKANQEVDQLVGQVTKEITKDHSSDSPFIEETEEGINLEDTTEEQPKQEEQKQINDSEVSKLPPGVIRNSDGNIETMSAEQQIDQLGINGTPVDSMIDDNVPIIQETTPQQEEVHGSFFNMYESQALKAGELVPVTQGAVYEWLSNEGINLGAIIDNELSNIIKVNPKIQLMTTKANGVDNDVSSNIFLVVEYTDKVSKHHLPENGGVISSNGRQYLIVGTMWNTKQQNGTEAANLMQSTRNTIQRNRDNYFMSNPLERFYVDPVMNTEITTFYSGHIVNTVNQEPNVHTITELIDEYNKLHTSSDNISASDLGFGVVTMKEGFYPIGPIDIIKAKRHKPQKYLNPDKYGQIYVLVKAANDEVVPIFINPILLSEMRDGQLKSMIDTDIIPRLLSEDYYTREEAVSDLCKILCISGSIKDHYGKGILIGTQSVPTVSLVNGTSTIATYQLKDGKIYRQGQEVTMQDFREGLYNLNPRVNVPLSALDTQNNLQSFLRYDEAGALTTDSAKLGTFGGKYYVAPINPATGQPIRIEQKPQPTEINSDYSKAQFTPTMLLVGGQAYVLRNGKWIHQKDGSAVTDNNEQIQVAWAYKVQTGEAVLAKRQGNYNYYTIGLETSNPTVVAYNLSTRQYQGTTQDQADQIIAERRAEIEKAKADAEAQRLLNQQEESSQVDTTEQPVTEMVESQEEVQPSTIVEETEQTDLQEETTVKQKNDFELEQTTNQDKYSVDQILDSTDDAMMEYADKIFEIIENKIATSEKWKDFDMNNITAELERLNIDTSNIEDVESWIDNLEHCE